MFAVTAACAQLLKLSVAQTETALAIATSLAAGIKANFGTMTKPLHAGQCARGGLFAALLARKGFTANPDAFEHKQGFFNVFNGEGNYDAAARSKAGATATSSTRARATSCTRAATARTPRSRRRSTWCSGTACSTPAIARIDRARPARARAHRPPRSRQHARRQIQRAVLRGARALDGKIVLEHFEGDAYSDRRCASCCRGCMRRPIPAPFADDFPFGAEVTVTLTDGSAHTAKVERPLGRTSDNPIAPEQMRAKFEDCAGRVLAPGSGCVCRAMESLEKLGSVRELTTLLERRRSVLPRQALGSGVPEDLSWRSR